MEDTVGFGDEIRNEIAVSDASLDEIVLAGSVLRRRFTGFDISLLETDIVERFEGVENDDVVAVRDELFREVTPINPAPPVTRICIVA